MRNCGRWQCGLGENHTRKDSLLDWAVHWKVQNSMDLWNNDVQHSLWDRLGYQYTDALFLSDVLSWLERTVTCCLGFHLEFSKISLIHPAPKNCRLWSEPISPTWAIHRPGLLGSWGSKEKFFHLRVHSWVPCSYCTQGRLGERGVGSMRGTSAQTE